MPNVSVDIILVSRPISTTLKYVNIEPATIMLFIFGLDILINLKQTCFPF